MKRIALFAAVAASIMVLPSSSSAITDCSSSDVQVPVGGATVGVEAGGDGVTGNSEVTAVGLCVDNVAPAEGFHGGYVEAGTTGTGGAAYVIVDGDDQNAFPNSAGYIGLSNYETGAKGDCSSGTGTNSGGCFQIRDTTPPLPVPLIACGNTTGPSWPDAGRDGCIVP